jgi:hypothetical protein
MRRLEVVVLLLALSGCTVGDPPEAFLDSDRPPALAVFPPYVEPAIGIEIRSFAYCWELATAPSTCVDGAPEYDNYQLRLANPGGLEILRLTPPVGWSFTGSAQPSSDPAGSPIPLDVSGQDGLVVAFPEAGTWDVTLTGQGPQGDAAYAFQVTVGEER